MPDSQPKTIFMAGGGTGGHLYPGIAVAESLRRIDPDVKCVFLCTTREIDKVILEPTGFEFIPQPIERPHRSVGGLLKFWKSWRETMSLGRKLLKERQPAAVVGLGGDAARRAGQPGHKKRTSPLLIHPRRIPRNAQYFLMKKGAARCLPVQ